LPWRTFDPENFSLTLAAPNEIVKAVIKQVIKQAGFLAPPVLGGDKILCRENPKAGEDEPNAQGSLGG
jgi:hypothetical protein